MECCILLSPSQQGAWPNTLETFRLGLPRLGSGADSRRNASSICSRGPRGGETSRPSFFSSRTSRLYQRRPVLRCLLQQRFRRLSPMLSFAFPCMLLIGSQMAVTAGDTVRATGIGRARPGLHGPQARLMAERASQVTAARNLLAKTAGVPRIESGRARWIGTLRGHRYLPTRYERDGTALSVVEWPISPRRLRR